MYNEDSREDLLFMGRKKQKIKKVQKTKASDIKALKCPCCGATLPLSDSKSTTCSYCGVNVMLSDNLLILGDEQSKKIAQDKLIIREYESDDELAPSMEEIENENRERHTIVKVEKGSKTRRLSDRKISILKSLGFMSINGIVFYIMVKYYPPNQSNNDLSFLVRALLLLGSLIGADFGFMSLLDDLDKDDLYDKNDDLSKGGNSL